VVDTLLLELIKIDRIIMGLLLVGNRARVVWPLLEMAKKKRYGRLTGANLP
jgi:hypothetical protein